MATAIQQIDSPAGPSVKRAESHTISLMVHDRPGVLSRIAQVFARRGFNIDSLVVSPAHREGFSRMTITCSGEKATLDQIVKQLNKLVDTVHATEHAASDETVERELALFTVSSNIKSRRDILQICEVFRAKTVDISEETISIEVTGTSSKLDAFEDMVAPFGIREMVRSGKLILARGLAAT